MRERESARVRRIERWRMARRDRERGRGSVPNDQVGKREKQGGKEVDE